MEEGRVLLCGGKLNCMERGVLYCVGASYIVWRGACSTVLGQVNSYGGGACSTVLGQVKSYGGGACCTVLGAS